MPGRRGYAVELAGVGGPHSRSGRTAASVLAALVALVVAAILLSRQFPVDAGPAAGGLSDTSAAGSAATSAAPVPSAPLTPRVNADPVDVAALVAAIPRHGTGPLAFVAGRLHSTKRRCEPDAPLSACLTLAVDGLRGARVVPDDTMTDWPGDPAPGETLVLLPRDGALVYLGSLAVDPAGIPRIDVLAASIADGTSSLAGRRPSLLEAAGVLVSRRASCPASGECPSDAPTLLAIVPSDGLRVDLTDAQPVGVVGGAFGVQAGGWTTGPFLLRQVADANVIALDVVAREDQGSILHVVIP